ncbi:MAG: SRPBCC domain-containing protein [Acidimicrobiales bacterium]
MTKQVKKTFTVAVPADRAWEAFADPHERSQWEALEYEIDARPGGHLRWMLPGIEATGRVEEVQPHRFLRHTELTGPHAGCEVTVSFEEITGGTRITITHAGFGSAEQWDEWLEGTSLGWGQAIADLIVYLHTGVPARRFATAMNSPGMTMADTDGGIEVRTVVAGGMADQAGLRAGDLVLRVGGVPVFSIAEVWVLMREHHPGATLEIEYVRGGERLHGVGVLSDEWSPAPVANPSR